MDLDELDAKLLQLLLDDGTRSYRELARLTGSTAPTVRSHLDRLKDLGLVGGVRADVDLTRFGRLVLVSGPASALEHLADDERVHQVHRTLQNRVVALALVEDDAALAALHKDHPNVETQVLTERMRSDAPRLAQRSALVSCSLCGNPVHGEGIHLRLGGRAYVACCPTCRRELERRYGRHAKASER